MLESFYRTKDEIFSAKKLVAKRVNIPPMLKGVGLIRKATEAQCR
jgi:hypothetical protein